MVATAFDVGTEAPQPRTGDDAPPPRAGTESSSPRVGARPRATITAIDLITPGLVVLAALMLAFSLQLLVVSRFENRAAQTRNFARLRNELAHGTAPLGQTDRKGVLLPLGSPVALLEIPSLHLKQVVLEGTTPHVLTSGPGHLRTTVLPGQAGTSAIYGRASAYGGAFGRIHSLRKHDTIKVTIGGGTATFQVIDVRHAGDRIPAPVKPGSGRLTLVTATGWSFIPTGIVQVDADLTTRAIPANPLVAVTIGRDERALGTDTGGLASLVLWLQALIVAVVAGVWAWKRWGRAHAWIVFSPVVLVVGYYVSDQVVRLLPNLL